MISKTVTRYNFCTNEAPHIRERADGGWVRWEDYERLTRENECLRHKVTTLANMDGREVRRLRAIIDAKGLPRSSPDETKPEPKLLAAEINALPQRVRDYIHHLETDADPAGDKWRLAAAEENIAALTAMLAERDSSEETSGE